MEIKAIEFALDYMRNTTRLNLLQPTVLIICRSFLHGTSFHRRFPVPLPFTLVIHYRFFIGSMDRPCQRHSDRANALASLQNSLGATTRDLWIEFAADVDVKTE